MDPLNSSPAKNNRRFAALALIFILLAAVAAWLVFRGQNSFAYPAPYLGTFLNMPEGVSLNAVLENGRKVTPLGLDEGGNIKVPETQSLLNQSYIIRLQLNDGQETAKDIALKVVKGDEGIRVFADGYAPENLMTLSIDNVSFFQDVPFDWSGKLELPSVIAADQNVHVCFTIKTTAPPFGFCHVVAARKRG